MKFQSILCTLLMGLLLASIQTQATACPAHTNKAGYYEFKECIPKRTPIEDKSGVKPKTAEEKSVRKAADHFLRMELSLLTSADSYESEVHFAPVGKKYFAIPLQAWAEQKNTAPLRYVCNKALLTGWKTIGPKKYQFDYQVQSAAYYKIKPKPAPAELIIDASPIKASYQLSWVDGLWKLSRAEFVPNLYPYLLSDYMVFEKRKADANAVNNGFARTVEDKKIVQDGERLAQKRYHLLREAERKTCIPFIKGT